MYNVKISCSNLIVQKHVDTLCYMPLIDNFYKENDKHELKSQIESNEQYNNNNKYKLEPPKPVKMKMNQTLLSHQPKSHHL